LFVYYAFQPPWDEEIGKAYIIHYTYDFDYNMKVVCWDCALQISIEKYILISILLLRVGTECVLYMNVYVHIYECLRSWYMNGLYCMEQYNPYKITFIFIWYIWNETTRTRFTFM